MAHSKKKIVTCLIFEHGFEAVRSIFRKKIVGQIPFGIYLGILLPILRILIYSGPQMDDRSKSYDHWKFTCHFRYFCSFSLLIE